MIIAIDIGATKTLIAAFSTSGHKLKSIKFKTSQNQQDFLRSMSKELQDFTNFSPSSIIVAIPGVIKDSSHFQFGNRNWQNPDISGCIKKLFNDVPVFLQNDANLATIFEAHRRRGRCIYLTFSTGIGGGIAQNGQLQITESTKFEPGHLKYTYNGHSLEWEDIASCKAIGKDYNTIATSIRGKSNYQDIAFRVSLGLIDIINNYHPDTIIIGGPLAKKYHQIRPYLYKILRDSLPDISIPHIIKAKRPTESVIYGCYLYARKH